MCYLTTFIRNPNDGTWSADSNVSPQPVPGNVVFGAVTSANLLGDGSKPAPVNAGPTGFDTFTTFNIIFAPNGSIVMQVNGANVDLVANYSTSVALAPTNPFVNLSSTNMQQPAAFLWPAPATGGYVKPGAAAFTLFDYAAYEQSGFSPSFISTNGQLIGINVYTGQPFPRK
jgi:hypothetical protein